MVAIPARIRLLPSLKRGVACILMVPESALQPAACDTAGIRLLLVSGERGCRISGRAKVAFVTPGSIIWARDMDGAAAVAAIRAQ